MNDKNNSSLARGMLVLAFIIVLGMLSLFFNNILDKQRNPNQQVLNATSSEGLPEVVLQRNRQGHYIATGLINGHEVVFMLDTGATDVSIPADIAKVINLKPGREVMANTANGTITVRKTRLNQVELGAIALSDIKATINPYMDADDEILLGMSFLKKLELIQRGDTLLLRQYQRE